MSRALVRRRAGSTRPGVARAYSSITVSVCRPDSRRSIEPIRPRRVEAIPDESGRPLDADPALAVGARLRQHDELAVPVLEEPRRPLVDQLADAVLHQALETRRPELDGGLPAAGDDHAALHETVDRVAAESRPVPAEPFRPLLEKPLGALEEPPGLGLQAPLDSREVQCRVHGVRL